MTITRLIPRIENQEKKEETISFILTIIKQIILDDILPLNKNHKGIVLCPTLHVKKCALQMLQIIFQFIVVNKDNFPLLMALSTKLTTDNIKLAITDSYLLVNSMLTKTDDSLLLQKINEFMPVVKSTFTDDFIKYSTFFVPTFLSKLDDLDNFSQTHHESEENHEDKEKEIIEDKNESSEHDKEEKDNQNENPKEEEERAEKQDENEKQDSEDENQNQEQDDKVGEEKAEEEEKAENKEENDHHEEETHENNDDHEEDKKEQPSKEEEEKKEEPTKEEEEKNEEPSKEEEEEKKEESQEPAKEEEEKKEEKEISNKHETDQVQKPLSNEERNEPFVVEIERGLNRKINLILDDKKIMELSQLTIAFCSFVVYCYEHKINEDSRHKNLFIEIVDNYSKLLSNTFNQINNFYTKNEWSSITEFRQVFSEGWAEILLSIVYLKPETISIDKEVFAQYLLSKSTKKDEWTKKTIIRAIALLVERDADSYNEDVISQFKQTISN